ncbi:cold-shock protein [Nonomuraea fuscirosea]|uniref:cold-shock protein n=1 Tax=Nonomuraea fuscirosea TaxID=1291556 RepID=UPI00348618DE
MAEGVVKIWKMEEGWGVIASSEFPQGHEAWVHFSDILGPGYRTLEIGGRVEFEVVQRRQDGFDFVATHVRRL